MNALHQLQPINHFIGLNYTYTQAAAALPPAATAPANN